MTKSRDIRSYRCAIYMVVCSRKDCQSRSLWFCEELGSQLHVAVDDVCLVQGIINRFTSIIRPEDWHSHGDLDMSVGDHLLKLVEEDFPDLAEVLGGNISGCQIHPFPGTV